MGLLSQGSPLSWEETKRHADHVRRHGILQFLHIYHAVKDRHKDVLKWGDEVSPRAFVRPGRPRPHRRPGSALRLELIHSGRVLGGPKREGCVRECVPASRRPVSLFTLEISVNGTNLPRLACCHVLFLQGVCFGPPSSRFF